MFGDDPDDGDDSADFDHLDVQELARQADGDSVTAARLRGDEQYFPDCRPFLQEGQQPHHLILLTTAVHAFKAEGSAGSVDTHTNLSATSDRGGVAIPTGSELLIVVDDAFCEIPFTNLQGILRDGDSIELHGIGYKGYSLNVATSADEREVDAAVDYLRRRIRLGVRGE